MKSRDSRKIINPKSAFIIAEISANHNQKFDLAVKLIKQAKQCGVDAVKFQAYTPDTLTLNVDNKYFRIRHPEWGGQTLYQLYSKAYTPWDWFPKLKKVCDEVGISFFSSAFDKTSVDMLENINIPLHKISSFEIVDLPLIEYVAKTKKPLIISTGMANRQEIREAVYVAKKAGVKDLYLLKCVSSYPADPAEMNLKSIEDMKKYFGVPIGLSDHTLGIGVSVAAVALGATVIEKHFISTRSLKTPDSFFSMEPHEMKLLVDNIRLAQMSIGKVSYGITEKQKQSRIYRRSLFAVKDIQKGEALTEYNVRSVRPSNGLPPKYLNKIIGRKALQNIKKGTPISFKLI